MRVLIACEESQTTANIFRSHGVDAWSCDIQPCSGGHPEYHIQDDALYIARQAEWDMMIAHPPCTFITAAGAHLMYPQPGVIDEERYKKCKEAASFFLALWNLPIPRICIENPRPLKCAGLPNYSQVVQPERFGSIYSKRTCLWLKNLPPLMETVGGHECPTSFVFSRSSSKARSKSFPEVSEQMYIQWIKWKE